MEFYLSGGLRSRGISAATQIEGGCTGHSWKRLVRQGHIRTVRPRRGLTITGTAGGRDVIPWPPWASTPARFGVEWSRLMPEEGRPDARPQPATGREIEYMPKGHRPLDNTPFHKTPWF